MFIRNPENHYKFVRSSLEACTKFVRHLQDVHKKSVRISEVFHEKFVTSL
jgi:hypothetical protein